MKETISAGRQWFTRHPRAADVMLASALTAVTIPLRLSLEFPGDPVDAVVIWTLLAAQAAPLVWRRTRPWLVMIVVSAAFVAFELADPVIGFRIWLFVMCAVYAVARYAPPPRSLAAVGVGVFTEFAPDLLFRPLLGTPLSMGPEVDLGVAGVAVIIGSFGGLWLLGSSQRHIHADAARLRDLAARLSAEKEVSATHAVTAERARIARDLHDLVAHHVSAIAMQARATAELLTDDRELAHRGVAGIGDSADTALLEMRRMLRLLSDGDVRDPLPEPSLRHLQRLAAAAGTAGCEVAVDVVIGPEVPAAVQVAAYRVVQEALTNVLKHAGPTPARVEVRQAGQELSVMVDNAPTAVGHLPMTGSGLGLIGMRERVALFGGVLQVGPRSEGGWRVLATFRWEHEP